MLENSPSNVAPSEKPLIHFHSADAVTSAESAASLAPLITNDDAGNDWNVTARLRSVL